MPQQRASDIRINSKAETRGVSALDGCTTENAGEALNAQAFGGVTPGGGGGGSMMGGSWNS